MENIHRPPRQIKADGDEKSQGHTATLAEKYYNEYANTMCKAVYQRYPKKDYAAVGLFEKIEKLRMEAEE